MIPMCTERSCELTTDGCLLHHLAVLVISTFISSAKRALIRLQCLKSLQLEISEITAAAYGQTTKLSKGGPTGILLPKPANEW